MTTNQSQQKQKAPDESSNYSSDSAGDSFNSGISKVKVNGAVSRLTKDQKEELKEAFSVFDIDGDGNIAAEELKVVLEAIGRKVTLEDVKVMILKVDDDGTGTIEYPEFLQLMAEEMESQKMDEELIEAFKRFGPSNEEEGMTMKQLGDTLKEEGEALEPDELKILFEETDTDGDGVIGMSDFLLMMMAK